MQFLKDTRLPSKFGETMKLTHKVFLTLKTRFFILAFLYAFLFVFPPTAHSQTLEPRLYANAPTRLNFLVLGYGYSQGDVLVDPTLPIKDLNARIHLPILAYVRSLNVWGKSGKSMLCFLLHGSQGAVGSKEKQDSGKDLSQALATPWSASP